MTSNIFESVSFLNEIQRITNPDRRALLEGVDITNESAYAFSDCSIFVTEAMIDECSHNLEMIRCSAILEGAKMDTLLKNFIEEGKDYKGLKKDLKEIIAANKLSDEELKTGKGEYKHVIKRILQVLLDIEAAMTVGGVVGTTIGSISAVIGIPALLPIFVGAILGLVGHFFITRLLRLLVDKAEFKAVKEDAEAVVKQLRDNASKTKDAKAKKKYEDAADKLEESISKYSKKHNEKKD